MEELGYRSAIICKSSDQFMVNIWPNAKNSWLIVIVNGFGQWYVKDDDKVLHV